MRVLFSTPSPARYMRPPILGDRQINCGPDWADTVDVRGQVVSLATPVGAYDLAAIATRLPAEQQPDVVVCLVDASRRNLPGNLGAFKCPRVLLVADTHHMSTPLTGLLHYAGTEPYDRIVLLYDRHHAGFFRSAGIRNLYWFPGLTFPHSDAAVQAARRGERERRIAFVGQVGRFHPRRQRLLDALAGRGIAVEPRSLPQDEALGFYGASLLGFNASLNGDLNLRVFEILSVGAALLTDRLVPAAGLESLVADRRELLLYGSAEELAERAAAALIRPAETRAVGAAGARWFDEHFCESRRRAAFQRLVFDGTPVPEFDFPEAETGAVFFEGNTALFTQSLMVYEEMQEVHRLQEVVRIGLGAGVPEDFRRICTTLPRMQCGDDPDGPPTDLAVVGHVQAAAGVGSRASRLWSWNTPEDEIPALAQTLGAAGFWQMALGVAWFRRDESGSDGGLAVVRDAAGAKQVLLYTDDPDSGGVAQNNHAAALLAEAREFVRQDRFGPAFAKVLAALEKDPRCIDAHVLLGQLALKRPNGAGMAAKSFRAALALAPGTEAIEGLLAAALIEQGRTAEASLIVDTLLGKAPRNPLVLELQAKLRSG